MVIMKRIYWIFAVLMFFTLGCGGDDKKGESEGGSGDPIHVCPIGQHWGGNICVADVPSGNGCPTGQHKEGNVCVDDVPAGNGCPTGQHKEGNVCVDDAPAGNDCPTGQHKEGNICVDDEPVGTGCDATACAARGGGCSQGVCVTPEMRQVEEGDACDLETYVEFCWNEIPYYCDQGGIPPLENTCDEGCVVYEETFWGKPHKQAGCIDGGACTVLDEIRTECVNTGGVSVVYAKACQMTAENGLQWVSVDGYVCMGGCDSSHEKCADVDGGCNLYDESYYGCDHLTLSTCYINSNHKAESREEYCEGGCVVSHGIPMCGFACDTEGAREKRCVHGDSMDYLDSGDFVCKRMDNGELYSVWTTDYDFCLNSCDARSGECL